MAVLLWSREYYSILQISPSHSQCSWDKIFCPSRCASGCVVECRFCNREVAGSNLGRGYNSHRGLLSRPFHPSGVGKWIPAAAGNLRQRQVWLIPLADETQGVQVILWYPLTMRAIPERLKDGRPSRTILDRTYSAQRFFIFTYFFIFFLFWVVR